MLFNDLPVGTLFVDDTELGWDDMEEMLKVSDTEYSYPFSEIEGERQHHSWPHDHEVYPVLQWEDELK